MRKLTLIGLAFVLTAIYSGRGQQPPQSGNIAAHQATATNASPVDSGQSTAKVAAAADNSTSQTNAAGHFQGLSDQENQRRLVGTWVTTWGKGQTTTDIIAASGNYVSETVGLPKGQKVKYDGKFVITNGLLNGEAYFGTNTVTMHLNLVQLDDHVFAWTNFLNGTGAVFHKVEK